MKKDDMMDLESEDLVSIQNVIYIIDMCASSIENKLSRKFLEAKKSNDIKELFRKTEYIQRLEYELKGIYRVKAELERCWKGEKHYG